MLVYTNVMVINNTIELLLIIFDLFEIIYLKSNKITKLWLKYYYSSKDFVFRNSTKHFNERGCLNQNNATNLYVRNNILIFL